MTFPQLVSEWPNELPVVGTPNSELVNALSAYDLNVSVDHRDRAEHGRDWWPLSLGKVARGIDTPVPDVVVRPRNTTDVRNVMTVSAQLRIPVVTQGGRSSVVGGAIAESGSIALDTTKMNRVLNVDAVSGLVDVEAGCSGPDLERAARRAGLTVGHFPQSFELSTVGGWIACRGAGQLSNRYGTIDEIVRGLTVVTARGDVLNLGSRAPHESLGPDLTRLFIGSEGTLGVITSATLVARPEPTFFLERAYGVSDFVQGLAICRELAREGSLPAILRLYDVVESTRLFHSPLPVLIVRDEGIEPIVRATMSRVAFYCADSTDLGDEPVRSWFEHRNDVAALVSLWESGVVVDTIEVATSWSRIDALVDLALAKLTQVPGTLVASVHQSHAYFDGACLYFTFAGRSSDSTEYHRQAWRAVMEVTDRLGGAISHHHGVGRQRLSYMSGHLGSASTLLGDLKAMLDPDNLLNPGVLVPPREDS